MRANYPVLSGLKPERFLAPAGLPLPRPGAEAAHLPLAAASAAQAPALAGAARVLLAALAPRAAADRMARHAKPPDPEDQDGDEHQHGRAAHRDHPPDRARLAPARSRRAPSGDAMSPFMPAPGRS